MDIDTKIIDDALSFYEIDNMSYKVSCYRCLENLKNNSKLYSEFQYLYNILFSNEIDKIRSLWSIKSLDKLFSVSPHPYITNLLLLSGYKVHKENMEKYKLDDVQVKIHKLRVKESLINDILFRKYNGIRISQMLWGTYFINIRLIEVGRLQYERCENYIKIHIPANDKLDINEVKESLNNSKLYIEKYFNMKDYKYYCNSWLLSKQIHSIVDKNSNIYKFYDLFDVEDGESCIDDILNFVYQLLEIKNYANLPENTTLQRNIKKYLLNGNNIKLGKGILKNEEY